MSDIRDILGFAGKKIAFGAFRWGVAGLILGGAAIGVANVSGAFGPQLAWGESFTGKGFAFSFAVLCGVAFGYVGVVRGLAHTALYVALEKGWAKSILAEIFSRLGQQLARTSLEETPEELAAPKTDLLPLETVKSALRAAIDQASSFVDDAYDEGTKANSGPIVARAQRFLADKIESLLVAVMVTDALKGDEVSLVRLREVATERLDEAIEDSIRRAMLMQTLSVSGGLALLLAVAVYYF